MPDHTYMNGLTPIFLDHNSSTRFFPGMWFLQKIKSTFERIRFSPNPPKPPFWVLLTRRGSFFHAKNQKKTGWVNSEILRFEWMDGQTDRVKLIGHLRQQGCLKN